MSGNINMLLNALLTPVILVSNTDLMGFSLVIPLSPLFAGSMPFIMMDSFP